jgi:hypothetical protein
LYEHRGDCTMSGRKSDQGSKEEIAKGMAEAGKEAAAKPRRRGKGASDADEIAKGMAETGSGAAPGIKGASDRAKGNPR